MNTAPTSSSPSPRNDGGSATASATSGAAQPPSAFELLFGSSVVLPHPAAGSASPTGPHQAASGDPPEPASDAAAAAADWASWLQQLPLAPLPGAALPNLIDTSVAQASLEGAAAVLARPDPAPPSPFSAPWPLSVLAHAAADPASPAAGRLPTGAALPAQAPGSPLQVTLTTQAELAGGPVAPGPMTPPSAAAALPGQVHASDLRVTPGNPPLATMPPPAELAGGPATPGPMAPPSAAAALPGQVPASTGDLPVTPSVPPSEVPSGTQQPHAEHSSTARVLADASPGSGQPPAAGAAVSMATSAPGSMPGPNQLPGLPLQRLRAEVKQAPPVAPATAPSGQVGPPAATLPPLPAGLLSDVVTRALLQRTEQPSLSPPAPLTATSGSLPESLQTPLQVALPPGSAPKVEQAFNEGMAVRLQWMTQQQMGRAEIQLHPAELGSIDVQIEFEGKAVRAEFLSASGEVRQLLEAGLPRLRELLEAQGLQLQHADVGSGGGRETGRDSAQAEPGSFRDAASENAAPTDGPARPAPRRHDGNLSEYA